MAPLPADNSAGTSALLPNVEQPTGNPVGPSSMDVDPSPTSGNPPPPSIPSQYSATDPQSAENQTQHNG
jgi:hypothetical protein